MRYINPLTFTFVTRELYVERTRVRTDCSVAGVSICVGLEVGDDSVGSLPHEHLTVWPFISVPWTATIACVADSFVLNLHPQSSKTTCD